MAGRESGDHLGGQPKPVEPGGGGDSMLAAATKRIRQEMAERRRPSSSPPSASSVPVPPPPSPLLSKVRSVAPLAANPGLNQLVGTRPPGGKIEELARAIQ